MEALLLLLFVISGAAAGFLGVDLLPPRMLIQVTNLEGLQWVMGGFGAFFGLIAGFLFQRLRAQLMRQVRTMPTDLLISRAVGLILGLLVANLLLAPILLDMQRSIVRRAVAFGIPHGRSRPAEIPESQGVSRQPARAPCGPGRACAREPVFCREGSRFLIVSKIRHIRGTSQSKNGYTVR